MGRYRLASHRTTRIMKIFVALSTLLAAATCQEAQVLATYAGYHPYAAAGYPYAAAPYAAYAPYSAGSQFHAQDEFGNLNYGYTNINSVKQEVGNAYGGVTGGYSYVDANNQLQRVEYVADGLGFRVADSRLPVAPVYDGVAPTFNPEPLVAPTFNPEPLVAPVFTGVAPEPVQDTPEVAEAKAAHLALLEAANAERKRRSADEEEAVVAAPTIAALPYPYAAGLNLAGLPTAGLPLNYAGLAGVPALNYAGVAGVPALNYAGLAGVPALNYAVAAPAVAAPVATVAAAAAPLAAAA